MTYTVVLHVTGAEPILGEMDDLPKSGDQLIRINHPRRLDGKDLAYLMENVVTIFYPVDKINFIEVLPGEGEERIIGFVRE